MTIIIAPIRADMIETTIKVKAPPNSPAASVKAKRQIKIKIN